MSDDRQYRATLAAPIVEGLRKRFAGQEIFIYKKTNEHGSKAPKASDPYDSAYYRALFRRRHQCLGVRLSCSYRECLGYLEPRLSRRIYRLRKASSRFLPGWDS